MYISRANKVEPVKPIQATFSSLPDRRSHINKEARALAEEFCDNTSIHGVKYFLGSSRALIEKTWWILVFFLSLYGCGMFIQIVYDKWDYEPVIVTFAQESIPVFIIPFPAVTICPESRAKLDILNFTRTYHRSKDPVQRKKLTENEIKKLQALLQVCEFKFREHIPNQTYGDDCVTLLKEMAIPQNEMFLVCGWRGKYYECSTQFRVVLTDVGFCYTFNSFANDDMFRTDQMHSEFKYIDETRPSKWSLQKGYESEADIDAYPKRVLGAGIKAGVSVLLKSNDSDFDYLCGNSFQGFKVLLHMPNEYPQLMNQHFRVPLNQEVTVSVTPRMMTTSEAIHSYKPDRRQCFFNEERYLRFFKVYTQTNCELECLANYTLERCGCVKFSMPRAPNVKICGVSKKKCYDNATVDLLEMEVNFLEDVDSKLQDHCNCLPSCTAVKYSTEVSQSSFNWKRLLPVVKVFGDQIRGVQLSHLIVFFKEAQFFPIVRNELFGLSDFLSNCGGLLGLFMGVSILSFVEIFYYCVIKPIVMWSRSLLVLKEKAVGVNVKPIQMKRISAWK